MFLGTWITGYGYYQSAFLNFKKMGNGLVYLVMAWGLVIEIAFLLVTFRWGYSLATGSSLIGLAYDLSLYTLSSLSILPLIVLGLYHFNVVAIIMGGVHKYKKAINETTNPVPFNNNSIGALISFIFRKKKWTRYNFEQVYLQIQADQGPWILLLTYCIAISLLVMSYFWGPFRGDAGVVLWNQAGQIAFVLVPVFLALFLLTLIHTTVGEFGGVWGVLLGWILDMILSRFGLLPIWSLEQGFLVFVSALVAWVMGFIGGIIFKGQIRMSMVAFTIEVNCTKDDECWLYDTLEFTYEGLQNGFISAHEILYGSVKGKNFVQDHSSDMFITPYEGRPMFGEDYHHLHAEDFSVPLLQEFGYVLCDNRLTAGSSFLGKHGWLPVLPRQRKLCDDISQGEMHLKGSKYCLRSENNINPI